MYPADISVRRAVAYTQEPRRLTRPYVAYFGGTYLRNVTTGRIYRYRRSRLGAGAAVTTVNKEIQSLRRVLAGAGLRPHVRTMPAVPRQRVQVDLDHLVSVARGNRHWMRALAAALLAEITGLTRKKLRALTWECQDPFQERLLVEGRSYAFTAPLREALIALEECRSGRCRPADRLLGGRSWKDAWRSLRQAAGMPGITLRDVSSRRASRQPPARARGAIRQVMRYIRPESAQSQPSDC